MNEKTETMYRQLMAEYEHEINSHFTDSLTGLFNHGFFQIALDREFKRSKRQMTPFTLALIDIDLFSTYNRLYGHVEGDRMLKDIAGLIKDNIREMDLAARYSGDVFAVVLAKSEAAQALTTMERIREAAGARSSGEITLSIGLASYPRDAATREGIIDKAQEALLQAKIKGKNRVDFFKTEKETVEEQKSRILVVDDEPRNLKLLEAMLLPLNYDVIKAGGGEEALSIVCKTEVDLILLDVMMPGMNGYEVCRRLKGNESTRLIPIVMVTALNDMDAKIRGIEAGVDDFITKPPNKLELLTRIKNLIRVKSLNNNLTSLQSVLFSLANAVEAKDAYTRGHVWRVSETAVALCKKMGLSEKTIKAIKLAGIIHDIGKIGVPEEILNKPGPLDPVEREIMQRHAHIGYKICLPLKKTLGIALDIIRHHHEKLDGSGFPNGLKGEEVSLGARIMAVVDIYDALVSDRPYRKAMTKQKALEILREEAAEGKLDSRIVEALIEMVQ